MKKILFCVFLALLFITAMPSWAQSNLPPPFELKNWYEYAIKRFPPMDCPWLAQNTTACVVMTELTVTGDAASGSLELSYTGENFSQTDQDVFLIGPASTFAITSATISLEPASIATADDPATEEDPIFVSPFFSDPDGSWQVRVPAGQFKVVITIDYDPETLVPVKFSDGIGRVKSDIKNGMIEFDDNFGAHGGEASLVLADTQGGDEAEQPRLRITRVFHWGAVVTFTYEVVVDGIQNEASVLIPLLAGEIVESVDPQKPFTIEKAADGRKYVQIAVQPSQNSLKIKGHFDAAPKDISLGDDLPFEIWLHEADTRHPVSISHNASPVDPGEFSRLVSLARAKAFFVKPGQKLTFTPVNLARDEGRKGQGSADYVLMQGQGNFWLEKLFLKAKLSKQDRLTISTPKPPIYAGLGNQGMELYHDENKKLSVRIPAGGVSHTPIEINWREQRFLSPLVSVFQAAFPPQSIYMDKQSAEVRLKPGYVPLVAWGADHVTGDMRDQFHLYGLLLAIFAFFVCRQLKFGLMLSVLVAILFVGLYLEPDFPTTLFLLLMLATLPWVKVGEGFIAALKEKRFRRFILLVMWLGFFVLTAVPLAIYGRVRVFQALHPYDQQKINWGMSVLPVMSSKGKQMEYNQYGDYEQKADYDYDDGGRYNNIPNPAPLAGSMSNITEDEIQVQSKGEFIKTIKPKKQGSYSLGDNRKESQKEWNPKPVNILTYGAGGSALRYDWFHLLENQQAQVRAVIAGPYLRGAWMLVEVAIVLSAMTALVRRAMRVFSA